MFMHPYPAGCALFQTHENLEHLAMMQQVLGPVPESMAVAAVRQARMLAKTKGSSSSKGGALKYFSSRWVLLCCPVLKVEQG